VLSLGDLLEARIALPADLSADGETVLVSTNLSGTMQLYRMPSGGGPLEQLTDDELAGISMPFIGGMILDAAAMVGLRLGEHALHTWDVAVTFDPAATVAPDAVDLLIDNVPGFLAPRLGRAPEVAYRVRIRASGPDRDYLLTAADPVTMTDWPGDGGGADTEISMPSEALLRLAYGRLDPAHTPAGVVADAGYLDRLRAMFPGF